MNLRMRTIQSVFVGLAFGWVLNVAAQTDTAGNVELRPGNVTASEQQTVAATLARQFGVKPGAELQIRAAGPYRFAGTEDFFLIQRQDLGSMAFETRAYGTSDRALEPKLESQEVLLPRVEEALRRAGFEIPDKRFANFQDEFAGGFP